MEGAVAADPPPGPSLGQEEAGRDRMIVDAADPLPVLTGNATMMHSVAQAAAPPLPPSPTLVSTASIATEAQRLEALERIFPLALANYERYYSMRRGAAFPEMLQSTPNGLAGQPAIEWWAQAS